MKLVILLLLVANISIAQTSCSLIVKVVDDADQEVEAKVSVKESNGSLHVAQNQVGGVRFCDLGLRPVDLIVGDEGCNQVIVHHVPVMFPGSVTRKIIYDRTHCVFDPPPGIGRSCHILVRTYDAAQRPLGNVEVYVGDPFRKTLTGDAFGRALILLPEETQADVMISSSGYITDTIRVACSTRNEQERRVVLKQNPAK